MRGVAGRLDAYAKSATIVPSGCGLQTRVKLVVCGGAPNRVVLTSESQIGAPEKTVLENLRRLHRLESSRLSRRADQERVHLHLLHRHRLSMRP